MEWKYDDLKKWIFDECNEQIGRSVVKLDISNVKLFEIPDEIFQLINLEYFDCSNIKTKNIQNEISKLTKLEHFNCSNNKIKNIPDELFSLKNLKYLNFEKNQIINISENLKQLIHLETLICNNCDVKKISPSVYKLIKLSYFDCSFNQITEISNEIGNLVNLKEFNCEYNQITEIPNEIMNCKKLLKLKYFPIKKFPSEINMWLNMRNISMEDYVELYVKHDKIKYEWDFKDLEKWIKNGCDMEIGNKVVFLNISGNNLKEIPKEIFKLINLEHFCCFDNEIKTIPKEIKNLLSLKEFYFNNNKIEEIPDEIKYLIHLEHLDCSANQIKEIPETFENLISLQYFYCHCNQISEIQNKLFQINGLKTIICNNNNIREIPKQMYLLQNLYKFDCSHNQISEIPKEIGRFFELQEFDCSYNKITNIPIEITNCRKLRDYFIFSNNEIDYIPPQVQRWLDRNVKYQKIYNDEQSVHNHNIQKGISKSIEYITQKKTDLNKYTIKTEIINNEILEKKTKELLFEYMQDNTVHSVLNITFEELLISVYDFALKHENKNEIFSVLNNEMLDSLCKCFTGRISRLINCLNGFDENIVINISDAEQIGNICILIKEQLGPNYTDDLFKEKVKKELQDRNYDDEVIDAWINNI